MKILPTGTSIYRGGGCKTHMAFFAVDPRVARMYGSLCSYKTIRPVKLFVITHNSLQKVFKFLSKNTRLLLSFVFGTGIKRTNQEITLKRLTGNSPLVKSFIKKGERLSVTELDLIAMAAFSKEYLNKYGFDGVYMPRKKSKFHKGIFHTELYISKPGILKRVSSKRGIKPKSYTRKSYIIKSIPNLFLEYTKNTKSLLKPYPSQFVMFLGGGMAVKLYLEARGIKSGAPTNDFDFKFALPHVLRSKKQIERYSAIMKRIMFRHVSGFIRFLKRRGINASMEFKEIEGVPLDRPGGGDSALRKKVYKVYNYTIVMPSGKRHELIDTSLVVVPKITRRHISLKWSRKFGLPIQTLTHLWKDTLYVLAGSFVVDTIKLRNPINGPKKEKGIKNAIRAGHLSYLVPRRYNLKNLVSLSRQLVTNVIIRNKKLGEFHSEKIIRRLRHLDRSRAQR